MNGQEREHPQLHITMQDDKNRKFYDGVQRSTFKVSKFVDVSIITSAIDRASRDFQGQKKSFADKMRRDGHNASKCYVERGR